MERNLTPHTRQTRVRVSTVRYFFRNLHQYTHPKSTYITWSQGVQFSDSRSWRKNTNFGGLSWLSIAVSKHFSSLSFSTHFLIFSIPTIRKLHFTKLSGCRLIFEILEISCFSRKITKLSKGFSLYKLSKKIFSFCNIEHELSVISDIFQKSCEKNVQISTCGLTTVGLLLLIFETRKLYHCENALQDFVNILSIFQFQR